LDTVIIIKDAICSPYQSICWTPAYNLCAISVSCLSFIRTSPDSNVN